MSDNELHKGRKLMDYANARKLRREETTAEAILWEALRGRKFLNLKFRRQHPVYSYIADFYCHELKLVVEVDGGYHTEEEQIKKDEKRTLELEKAGVSVIRFTNKEVLYIDNTLSKLKRYIVEDSKSPLLEGEG